MDTLLASWDEAEERLAITRPDGQEYRIDAMQALAGGHRVFAVETVGNEIHLLTGPRSNRQPNRRVKFTAGGVYKGNSGIFRR